MINRRKFLAQSVLGASLIPSVSLLTGCGESSDEAAPEILKTNVSTLVSSLQDDKTKSDGLHASTNNIAVASTVNKAVSRILQTSSLSSANYFSNKTPASTYLSSSNSSVWEQYATYNNLSYQQFTHQHTKLTASLRLYDYKKSQLQSDIAKQTLAATRAQLAPHLASTLDLLTPLVTALTENLTATSLDSITTLLGILKTKLDGLEDSQSTLYALATYISLDKLLEAIKEKAVSDLSFTNSEDIMMSLARMSIAAIALMGAMSIEKFSALNKAPARSITFENLNTQEIQTYLNSISIQSSLSMIMMELMNRYVSNTNNDVKDLITQLTSLTSSAEITPQEQELINTLENKLKTQSSVMAIVGVILKALFAMISSKATDLQTDGFTLDSDAANFSALFGSDTLPQDTAFTTFMSDLQTLLENNSSFADIFTLISSMSTSFSTTIDDIFTMTQSEESAFNTASSMSQNAYDFSVHMADLAYNFTMKIEDDAYEFAMQGMEYGYLFASQGEDVGIMADRILWMAVQIGQMADRIGEMSDRIVYTESLIVYTEMLILDFGLLIYGGMKMITNLMLTGMAVVLDREWYENDSEDQIVTLIGDNMSQMMENMQKYSLTVIKHQDDLREVTLSALDWVGNNTDSDS